LLIGELERDVAGRRRLKAIPASNLRFLEAAAHANRAKREGNQHYNWFQMRRRIYRRRFGCFD